MATKKPTKRSTTTTRAKSSRTNKTTKSKNLKKNNFDFLSWKVILPALLVFGLAGGALYFQSASASSHHSFIYYGDYMWGGTRARKWGGHPYRYITAKSGQKSKYSAHYIETNGIGSVVTKKTLQATSRVCAHIKNNASHSVQFGLMQKVNGKWRVASKAWTFKGRETKHACGYKSGGQFVAQNSQFAAISYGSRTVPFEVHYLTGYYR